MSLSAPACRWAVLGLGNVLRSDDGAGVHALRELERVPSPGVSFVEAGTAILQAVACVDGVERVLALDAVRAGGAPGSIVEFDALDAARRPAGGGVHSLGLREALEVGGLARRPVEVRVLGVEPANLGYGMDLSPAVAAALPSLLDRARRIMAEWTSGAPAGTVAAVTEACA